METPMKFDRQALNSWCKRSWTRRSVLASLGSGALAGALSAFATPKPPTLPECAGSGAATHERIDAHVHSFNGTDLQIAGFLKTAVSNEHPKFSVLLHLLAGGVGM
jgi:hypothetical protein